MDKLPIEKNISLSKFTTLRVGGPAEWLAEPKNIGELTLLIHWAKNNAVPFHVLGAGSNLLIGDSGLTGLSICMKKFQDIQQINPASGLIDAPSGEPIPTLARKAAKAGLHGLEWAVGIPGTVGGAVVMNAGAQGSCTAEWLQSVKVVSLLTANTHELTKKELCFAYRSSLLQTEQLVVISARLQLDPSQNQQEIIDRTNKNLILRTNSQPYDLPSCGSVFRNPEPLKAGKLIEQLGLKGHKIGGAEISKTHANFIVNTGNATAEDINQLIIFIQKQVKEAYGLLLHPEVKQLGFGIKD